MVALGPTTPVRLLLLLCPFQTRLWGCLGWQLGCSHTPRSDGAGMGALPRRLGSYRDRARPRELWSPARAPQYSRACEP